MAISVQFWSAYSLTIIAEPTGASDGAELDVPIRSVDALIKKLQVAKMKHERKYKKTEESV